MKKCCLIPVLLLIVSRSFAQVDIDKTVLVDGLQREYSIHLPPAYDSAQKLPVIFALHGGGGNYRQVVKFYKLNAPADKKGFIVVYPNAINKAWNMPGIASRVKDLDTTVDDVHFIYELMDTLIKNYKGDPKRMFTTGISRGGMLSLYLADKLSDRIAGIAPVCASISQSITKDYTFKHPTPVLLINGTADPLVKYNGGVGEFNRANEGNDNAIMLPAEQLVNKIVQLDNCDTNAVVTNMPDNDPGDGCTETESVYTGKAIVDFIAITNGGHAWPGGSQYLPKIFIGKVCRDFSAAEKITDFFAGIK
jgi:polyhydroxybutyrate depolymerase